MTGLRVKVLLVEDSPSDARLIQETLLGSSPGGFEVSLTGRLDAALARLQAERFDVILLDLGLPDCMGIDTLVRISAAAPQMPIVVLTGADDEAISLEAIRRGARITSSRATPTGRLWPIPSIMPYNAKRPRRS
jgi:DNA-binding response OmpR family regulator